MKTKKQRRDKPTAQQAAFARQLRLPHVDFQVASAVVEGTWPTDNRVVNSPQPRKAGRQG